MLPCHQEEDSQQKMFSIAAMHQQGRGHDGSSSSEKKSITEQSKLKNSLFNVKIFYYCVTNASEIMYFVIL